MATETQKKFKKQMAELEKQRTNTKQDSHYSYIEKDYITSYYSPKKTKRIVGISLGSIISFILIFYTIFSWLRPITNLVIPNKSITTMVVNSSLPINNKQNEVVDFLASIKIFEEETNLCIQNSVQQFNTLDLKDIARCDSFIRTNTEYMSKIYSNNNRLKEIKVPSVMAAYCITLSAKYSAIYEQMGACNSIASGLKKGSDIDFLLLSNRIKTQSDNQTVELLKVFDSVGIKYENINSQIKYWY